MRVFNTAPRGMRKIVLSTNIAEVSVTIPDVVFVIDTGLTKESRYDATTKTKCLVEMQVSKASARQRWGRAGRVRSGHCLNLYASTTFQKFAESQQPEMLRCSLEDICLQIISLGIDTDVQKFLSKSLTPPNPVQVSVAMSLLRNLGALTTENRITPLGRALAVTPVDVRLAKVLVLSQLLGCSDVVSVIVAALSIGSLFLLHSNTQIEYAEHDSDHMAYPSVIAEWKSSRKRHKPQGSALGISDARAKDTAQLADDLLDQLRQEKGLSMKVPMPGLSAAQKSSLVSACLCAGLEGNILITENLVQLPSVPQQQGQACRWTSKSSGEVALRRSAIDHYGRPKYPFLVYSEKLLIRHKAFARDCTVVHPMAVLLFGHKVMLAHAEGSVTINGWLKFEGATRTLSTVLAFRDAMHHMLDARLRGAPVAHVQHAEMIKLLVELISL
ncbi:DExH-box ATP-dependent RNA helicase DExH4 [Diplonema papillatum]|nr:DExH-box ATP-dependent RNA helicase DExH4 [Diplonema papillatum]